MSRQKIMVIASVIIIAVILIVGFLNFCFYRLNYSAYLGQFFFFQDPEFLNGLGSAAIKWEGSSWNFSSIFSGDFSIQDGLATLSYNESSGDEWGGTVLVQGKLPHSWGSYLQPLGGTTQEDAKPVEYVTFTVLIQSQKANFCWKLRLWLQREDILFLVPMVKQSLTSALT